MNATEGSDVERLLDPVFDVLVEMVGALTFDEASLPQLRMTTPGLDTTDLVERTEVPIVPEVGVSVRVHRPRGISGRLPCIFSMHGGGFILGSSTMDDAVFESWCPSLGVIGVSVDYRLAPEVPYPGPLDDCYLALSWVFEHAEDMGIDPGRVGICGVSAGGGLAAGLGLLARDRGELQISFQFLESPMLDDRQQTPSSQLEGLPVWSKETNEFGWRSYLGPLYGNSEVPIYAAPARATDLAGLPPTFISATGVDGFRDEDTEFGLRLQQAGVETEMHVVPGAPHGYEMIEDSYAAKKLKQSGDEWLRRVLARD